jgi:hypothetical protein
VETVAVPSSGRYQAWIESNLSTEAQLWIDGRRIGSVSYQLASQGQYVQMGQLWLSRGRHKVAVIVPFKDKDGPGQEVVTQSFGPLMLEPESDSMRVAELAPSEARRLCGKRLDWIEIVRQVPR